MSKQAKAIQWTIRAASIEWGVSQETIKRGLKTAEVSVKDTYTTREIDAALHSDIKANRARKLAAEARLAEADAAIAEKESIPTSEAEASFNRIMGQARQAILRFGSLGSMANPSDPEHATRVLLDEVDAALKSCREFKFQDK